MWAVMVILVGLLASGTNSGSTGVSTPVLVVSVIIAVVTSVPLARWVRPSVESVLWSHPDGAPPVLGSIGTSSDEQDLPGQVANRIARQLRLPYVGILPEGGVPAYAVEPERLTRIPLVFAGDRLGDLVAAPRARARSLAASDVVLLEELAGQVAVVLHAVRARDAVERSRAEVVTAREEERRRIRNDLHDGLGPTLASLGLHLAALERLIPQDPDQAVSMVDGLRGEVRGTSATVRELVYGLRPPLLDDVGLVEALRARAAELSRGGDLAIDVQTGTEVPELPAAVEAALYRITGEALANVRRHAHARRATVCLTDTGDSVLLRVEDDGRGLPGDVRPGVGLTSMRERAEELQGTLTVTPLGPAGGTRVEVRLPMRNEP